jgi:hypothetical protein
MWMKIKVWLYRRGLGVGPFYSPSAAMIWHKGTIFHPGKQIFKLFEEWKLWRKSVQKRLDEQKREQEN